MLSTLQHTSSIIKTWFECIYFITKAKYVGPKSVPDLTSIISLEPGLQGATDLSEPKSRQAASILH